MTGVLHPRVQELLGRKQYAQRTPEWYQVRECMLTASDAAAALDIKPFESYRGSAREELFRKKTDPGAGANFSNRFTEHGNTYEDEARMKYESQTGESVLEFGLLVHPKHAWLGASPDGVTTCGKVVEIKCPISREIRAGQVPHHYFPQVQIVMEVCDLEEAVFIQYKPSSITWPRAEEFDVTVVPRDRQWFADSFPKLESFYTEMAAEKERRRGAASSGTVVSASPSQPVTPPRKRSSPTASKPRGGIKSSVERCQTTAIRDDMYEPDSRLHVDCDPNLGVSDESFDFLEKGLAEQGCYAFVDDGS